MLTLRYLSCFSFIKFLNYYIKFRYNCQVYFFLRGALLKRIILSVVILLAVLVNSHPVQGSQEAKSVINRNFLEFCKTQDQLIPVFVELKNAPTVELFSQSFGSDDSVEYSIQLENFQNRFLSSLSQSGISYQFRFHLTETINGVSLQVKGKDIPNLISLPQVSFVYDNRMEWKIQRHIAVVTTGAKKVWTKSQNPSTGSGVVVGVIDSGMDATHAKKGEFKGRVLGGYDYADRDSNFDDNSIGHGTHVSGIIGGSGEGEFYRGMAYEVKYHVYKVFSDRGAGAPSDALSKAIDQSVKDKCHVINMSLGSEGGPAAEETFYHKLIRNAVKAGTIVVCATGNAGSRGKSQSFPAGLPGNVEEAFSVGATNDRIGLIFQFKTGTETKNIPTAHCSQTPEITKEIAKRQIVECGFGKPEEFPEEGLQGKIALIQRGPKTSDPDNGMTFREKMDNAIAVGASAVFVYDHSSGSLVNPSVLVAGEDASNVPTIPLYFMSQQDGLWVKARIKKELTLNLVETPLSIALFSSMGPTEDGFFKPEISAPGESILSTYKKGEYAIMGGTSMSCPAVTGLVALLRQVKPKWNNDQVKSALMNTAEILVNPLNNLPVTFQLQGAGEARIDKAVVTPAFLNPRALVIQKNIIQPGGQKPSSWLTCEVKNAENNEQQFDLSSQVYLLDGETNPIKIELKEESISVPGNKTASFSYRFTIDWSGMERSRYEGVIMVGASLHIPFIIYRDGVSKVPDAISDIRVSPSEVSFVQSDESEPVNNGLHLYFSMNSGLEMKHESFAGGTDYYNYNTIEAILLDENGDDWATIATFTNYVIGEYEYYWDGKLPNGSYFLPKGKYFIQFRMKGIDYNKREEFIAFGKSNEGKVPFTVGASSVPDPLEMTISTKKMITVDDLFTVDCVLPKVENLLGLEFTLVYDPDKLMIRDYELTSFFDQDGVEIETSYDEDDGEGLLTVYVMRDSDVGLNGSYQKFLTITFQAIDKGKVKWGTRNSKVWFSQSETASRMKVRYPELRIQKEDDYLLADLNDDDIVNQYDWQIFMDSYPSTREEKNFNSDADFNQDGIINFDDFSIFSKDFGKAI